MNAARLTVVPHGKTWAVKCGDDFLGVTRRLEDAMAVLKALMTEAQAEALALDAKTPTPRRQ